MSAGSGRPTYTAHARTALPRTACPCTPAAAPLAPQGDGACRRGAGSVILRRIWPCVSATAAATAAWPLATASALLAPRAIAAAIWY